MQALTRVADRGVKVRIYLDGAQLADREQAKVFRDLAETPGVEIRIKHETSTPMHLKSYQIDGRLLLKAPRLRRHSSTVLKRDLPAAKLCRSGRGSQHY